MNVRQQPERGVRYRPDVGFELRCDPCGKRRVTECYWPLTLEFWQPSRGMTMCRACRRRKDAQAAREKYARDPATRRRKLADARRARDRVKLRSFHEMRDGVAA